MKWVETGVNDMGGNGGSMKWAETGVNDMGGNGGQ